MRWSRHQQIRNVFRDIGESYIAVPAVGVADCYDTIEGPTPSCEQDMSFEVPRTLQLVLCLG